MASPQKESEKTSRTMADSQAHGLVQQPSNPEGQIVSDLSSSKATRRVLWKVDLVLMPLLGVCYMLQFLDKLTISYSTLLGLLKDTHLTAREYSWTSSIFYFGYLFWSWPTAWLAVRFPTGKYLATSVILWATVLMCTASATSFAGLMVSRFFLGMMEAAVAPGFSLITGMWYKRPEQPLRHGLWYAGNSIASIVGGVAAYGVGNLHGSLAPWRYLFLIFGAVTAFWGIVLLLLLPDAPTSAIWLSRAERDIAILRVADNHTGVKNSKFKSAQVLEALKDPQNYCLTLYVFCVNLANGGLTTFGSLALQSFGYTGLTALLIQMPAGAAQLGFVVVGCLIQSRVKNARTLTMLCLTLVSVTGMGLMYGLTTHFPGAQHRSAKLAGYCLSMGFAANMPLGLSLISSNVGGFTKKATVNACVFVAYCLGNIVGPQFFPTAQSAAHGVPNSYSHGFAGCLAGLGCGALFIFALGVYYAYENRRRQQQYRDTTRQTDSASGPGSLAVGHASESRSGAPVENLKVEPIVEAVLDEDTTDWESVRTFRYLL